MLYYFALNTSCDSTEPEHLHDMNLVLLLCHRCRYSLPMFSQNQVFINLAKHQNWHDEYQHTPHLIWVSTNTEIELPKVLHNSRGTKHVINLIRALATQYKGLRP